MPKIVLMPKLGLTMKKGKIINWLKQEGEAVAKGEHFLEVVTEKTNVKVEAQDDGVFYKILVEKGNQVPVNAPIAVLAEAGDDEALLQKTVEESMATLNEAAASLNQKKKDKQKAVEAPVNAEPVKKAVSPRAKKLAEKEGVDVALVDGTGPNGRVTEKDILTYIEDLKQDDETSFVPMEGMRQVIAQRMSESSRNAARVTVMEDVDVTLLSLLRKKINDANAARGIKISFTDMIIKIVAKALREHRHMNARVFEDKIELVNSVNISVAVDIEGGLVVPVIHKAHRLSLEQISDTVKDLAERARSGDLEAEELAGGTFTISNIGMFGAEGFTPIINPPETAILGIGTIVQKPALQGDNILRKSFMTLSLSFDHRAVDGGPAARFLKRIKELMEEPYELFGIEKDAGIKFPVVGGQSTPQMKYDKFKKGMDELLETAPDLTMGFGALTESIFYDGELSNMHKELMAVVLSLYIKCEYCIAAHIYKALKLGATPEQIMEACGVAVYFGGGAALAYTAAYVQDCIKTFTVD